NISLGTCTISRRVYLHFYLPHSLRAPAIRLATTFTTMLRHCQITLLVCIPAFSLLLGCSGTNTPSNPTELVPVSGSVTLDGVPMTQGVISFAPDIGNPVRVAPTAELNSSGQYELTTGGRTGAPPGKYKVCVSLEHAAEESRLKAPTRTRS